IDQATSQNETFADLDSFPPPEDHLNVITVSTTPRASSPSPRYVSRVNFWGKLIPFPENRMADTLEIVFRSEIKSYVIGRGKRSDFILRNPLKGVEKLLSTTELIQKEIYDSISKIHLKITKIEDSTFLLTNLGYEGTLLNADKVGDTGVRLRHGNRISISAQNEDAASFTFYATYNLTGKEHSLLNTHYEMVDVIGSGGYGEVWTGVKRETGEIFAVKEINMSRLSTKEKTAIRSEIEILNQLEHPNVIHIVDHYEDENVLYIVQDLVCEGSLMDQLRKKYGRLEEAEAKAIFKQLVEVLMVGPQKVLREKSVESVLGTPVFIAPEIVKGEPYDEKSDLFSIGICLYIILTGNI
ncbi:hypothetical protein HK098_001513, partial [Nowakowskiella sp. JEL0407]